jgi:AcrR family transcriptional regulator
MRERKKRERRDAIAAHALRLFADNGFERVTMREIAQAADVSEPTVFNYFPTKESLVFSEDRERELALLRAVRDRPSGTSIVVAFREVALELLNRHRSETDMDWFRVVQGSPTLQRHRRELYARQALSLAAVLKAQAGGGWETSRRSALRGHSWGSWPRRARRSASGWCLEPIQDKSSARSAPTLYVRSNCWNRG